ncbi:hypothetical protein Y032_0072g704 [Ancylostoma ceylanicum]|uniref:Uncharacterized protein n=1 Tax=Ancylostoma ceylanicum TaxID=53326 RepID=A0A016TVT9_9BILA|nr:hypothetical protein Y032_0072g704 [Ancylostoma ceylanicum]
MRDSLLQADPLSAALSQRANKAKALPTISRTPLLLQFTPFGPPVSSSCGFLITLALFCTCTASFIQ